MQSVDYSGSMHEAFHANTVQHFLGCGSAEHHAWRRHPSVSSSFYTTDLAQIDPRATCHSNAKACAVRNAVCESEVVGKDQKEPSYHCVCRPGSVGIAAGICVPTQCTRDAARVSVAANIAHKFSNAEGAQQAEMHAEEVQDRLDNRPEKVWAPAGITWFNKHFPGEELKDPTGDEKLKLTRQHEDRISESGEENVEEFVANKDDLWELKVQPKKYWTDVGKTWFSDEAKGDAIKGKEVEVSEEQRTQISEKPDTIKSAFKENTLKLWTEKDPAAKEKTFGENIRKALSAKEENLSEMFAGRLGVMPSVPIPGGSALTGDPDAATDFKIKIVVPEQTTLTGAGGAVEIGSQKLPPPLLDELGKVVGHLDRAQQLKKAIAWNDVKVPKPLRGNEVDVNQKDDLKAGLAEMGLTQKGAFPVGSLIMASLAPKWMHRNRSHVYLASRKGEKCKLAPRPSRTTVAQWSAFLILASTVPP